MTEEQRTRLKQFAAAHGPNWRDKLREMWMTGQDSGQPEGHLLRQVRNQVGPSKLDQLEI